MMFIFMFGRVHIGSVEALGILLLDWLAPLHGQGFGGEVYHFASASTNSPPGRCTLSSAIPASGRVVVLAAEDGNDYHVVA
jgi:hypothetical protein